MKPLNRSGKIGSISMVILMFSIVLFIGSLFWLYINGPWNGAEGKFFQQITNNASQEQVTKNSIGQNENISMNDAILDLQLSGITIINYNNTITLKKPRYCEYSSFKILAIERSLVIIINNEGGCLLTYGEKDQIVWIP